MYKPLKGGALGRTITGQRVPAAKPISAKHLMLAAE
jgi:hypothetical protein